MIQSRSRSRFLKHRRNENRGLFQKQRNKCVSLLQKAKKDYFLTLSVNNVADKRLFWKTVKWFLFNKAISSWKMTLIDNDECITDGQEVTDTLNDLFSSIATSLNLPKTQNAESLSQNIDHHTLKTIVKWRNCLSLLAITAVYEKRERFSFSPVTTADVAKSNINILNSS